MDITINIEDYVSPGEMKAMVMEEMRNILHQHYYRNESEINRMITNLSYEFIFKAVSEAIGEDAIEKISSTVKRLLEDDSNIRYNMWRKKDAWDKSDSPAIQIMDRAIKDSEGLIRTKVMIAIDEYEFKDIQTAIYESLDNIIYQKVFGKENN